MVKKDLQKAAQPFCDASFTIVSFKECYVCILGVCVCVCVWGCVCVCACVWVCV